MSVITYVRQVSQYLVNKVDILIKKCCHVRLMKQWGILCIALSLGALNSSQGQQALGDRVADLEKKLLESQKNTRGLAEQLNALKVQASHGMAPSLKLNGYVSSSFRYTPTSNVGNDLYGLSGGENQRDRFALDVVSLSLSSENKEDAWSSGFHIQTWIGPGADLLATAGDPNTSGAGNNEIAIKQAYINLHLPVGEGLGMKVGVFDKVIGYESTDRNKNPFHSHSWGYTVEPSQHTGFIFDYGLTDELKIHFGLANSTSPKINGLSDNDNRYTLIGALDYEVPEGMWGLGGADLTVGTVRGRPWTHLEGQPVVREEYYYLGLKNIQTPIEDLTAGAAWDIRENKGPGKNGDQVWGAYLKYEATDLLEFNFRGEKFQAGSGLGSSMSDGWGTTLGGTYKLWHNTLARFEYRYDDTDKAVGGRTKNKSLIWNLIYSF